MTSKHSRIARVLGAPLAGSFTAIILVFGFPARASSPSELGAAETIAAEPVDYVFKGDTQGQSCSLTLRVREGKVVAFSALGIGASKAVDIFGNCKGLPTDLYPCRTKGAISSGYFGGADLGTLEGFATGSWHDTTFDPQNMFLRGTETRSDSTRLIRLNLAGQTFHYSEKIRMKGLPILAAAFDTSCSNMEPMP